MHREAFFVRVTRGLRVAAPAIATWALLLLSACVVSLTLYRGLAAPLTYDDAYNLQIVSNLARGQGYASFGALHGGAPWPFDPHITTGPAVLFPVALVWWLTGGDLIAAHLVMLGFCGLYLCAVFQLRYHDPRDGLPWASALAFPLMLTFSPGTVLGVPPAPAPVTLAFMPGTILGEIPAAAFTVFAAALLARGKPIAAGILLGCAVQAKLTYVVAAAALFIVWALALGARRAPGWERAVVSCAAAGSLPLVAFELYRLVSLGGFAPYQANIAALGRFIAAAGGSIDRSSLGVKFGGLYQALEYPGWWGVVCALVTVALSRWWLSTPNFGTEATHLLMRQRPTPSLHAATHTGLILGAVLMLVVWIFISGQTTSRQGLPALLLGLPALGYRLGSVSIVQSGISSVVGLQRCLVRVCGGLALLFVLFALFLRTIELVRSNEQAARLAEQYRVAETLRASGAPAIAVDGWWQNPELLLLSGLPSTPQDLTTRQLLVVQDYQAFLIGASWMTYKSRCETTVYESAAFLVCWSGGKTAQ